MYLGKNIQYLRKQKKITQEKFPEQMAVSRQTVVSLEQKNWSGLVAMWLPVFCHKGLKPLILEWKLPGRNLKMLLNIFLKHIKKLCSI